mmetsp:Transcript_11258/g.39211  ORF Transcript_11258/g.39211 Transcript_11258/m.39211 type:complete len:379 (+) Transcript_11258:529-1665(+)
MVAMSLHVIPPPSSETCISLVVAARLGAALALGHARRRQLGHPPRHQPRVVSEHVTPLPERSLPPAGPDQRQPGVVSAVAVAVPAMRVAVAVGALRVGLCRLGGAGAADCGLRVAAAAEVAEDRAAEVHRRSLREEDGAREHEREGGEEEDDHPQQRDPDVVRAKDLGPHLALLVRGADLDPALPVDAALEQAHVRPADAGQHAAVGASESGVQREQHEGAVVAPPDARVQPRAVVVHLVDARLAGRAVVHVGRLGAVARAAVAVVGEVARLGGRSVDTLVAPLAELGVREDADAQVPEGHEPEEAEQPLVRRVLSVAPRGTLREPRQQRDRAEDDRGRNEDDAGCGCHALPTTARLVLRLRLLRLPPVTDARRIQSL